MSDETERSEVGERARGERSEPVLYDVAEAIATITLNRPENRNSMTPDVMAAFREAVARAAGDRSLRCVVLTGRGTSFCAGADFRSASPVEGRPDQPLPEHERLYRTYEPFLDVFDLPMPTVAALNGHAVGGGFGLALVCDLRVANRDAKYGANFAKLGFTSGMAISHLLPRIVGVPVAADMLLTGRLVNGAEAAAIGLAHEAVPADAVLDAAMRRARAVAACAPEAVRLMKRSLYAGMGWDPRTAARAEAFAQAATMRSDDGREGVRALLEKREPKFTGT
jgi:enoyl-CoA hydratase/carnithine racemase